MSLDMTSPVPSPPSLACPVCGRPADVKSRHVVVAGSAIRVYCSDACMRGLAVITEPQELVREPVRRTRWWVAAGIAVGSTFAALAYVYNRDDTGDTMVFELPRVTAPPPRSAPVVDDAARKADEALLRELMQDTWIHPLAGPRRRMPVNHMQAFGAAREGDPPPECLSGHCGVDIAGENIWGEPVHAVHDGVVSWVDRGPNEEQGGIFVKIAHRNGSLFSWYFHLAAVPRWVRPGAKVKVGQVIGLVGDTGVKQSAPHLHFSMTVRGDKAARERYIDPEPLIAIWALWIPDDHGSGTMSTVAPPGMPVRAPDRARRLKPAKADELEATPDPEPSPPEDAN